MTNNNSLFVSSLKKTLLNFKIPKIRSQEEKKIEFSFEYNENLSWRNWNELNNPLFIVATISSYILWRTRQESGTNGLSRRYYLIFPRIKSLDFFFPRNFIEHDRVEKFIRQSRIASRVERFDRETKRERKREGERKRPSIRLNSKETRSDLRKVAARVFRMMFEQKYSDKRLLETVPWLLITLQRVSILLSDATREKIVEVSILSFPSKCVFR